MKNGVLFMLSCVVMLGWGRYVCATTLTGQGALRGIREVSLMVETSAEAERLGGTREVCLSALRTTASGLGLRVRSVVTEANPESTAKTPVLTLNLNVVRAGDVSSFAPEVAILETVTAGNGVRLVAAVYRLGTFGLCAGSNDPFVKAVDHCLERFSRDYAAQNANAGHSSR